MIDRPFYIAGHLEDNALSYIIASSLHIVASLLQAFLF